MYECVLPNVESTSQKSQRNRKEQSIIYLFEEMVYGETEAEKLFNISLLFRLHLIAMVRSYDLSDEKLLRKSLAR